MNDIVTRIFPSPAELRLEGVPDILKRLKEAGPGKPFAEPVQSFMGAVSKRLLSARLSAEFPQLTALGFWIRPTIVARLKERYENRAREDGAVLVPRGLAFHLPPANVDVLFAYSWFLSLLAGNANLIRLPATLNPAAAALLDVVRDAAQEVGSDQATLIVSYPHSTAANEIMSRHCDVRVVWGGDVKVLDLRAVPLPVRAIQMEFSDRFSFAAFKATEYRSLPELDRERLAERFFNDVFWFDQMGCASPRLVAWIGDRAVSQALAADFHRRLVQAAQKKGYVVDPSTAIAKLAYADRLTLEQPVERVCWLSNELTVITFEHLADFRDQIMGAGTLVQTFESGLESLQPFLRAKDQTLVQYGFSREEIEKFVVETRGRGIDRVVAVGRALDFHHLWDGFDLIATFTRVVTVA